jgi:hypothetical protein
MEVKVCTICKVEKPLTEYSRRGGKEFGIKSACTDCGRVRARSYWAKNPLPKEIQRERNLQNGFGIGIKEYNEMLELQNGCCAICGVNSCASGRNFAVDHNHQTGKIRGLLCKFCNTALGQFKDDTTVLQKAIQYLERENYGNS